MSQKKYAVIVSLLSLTSFAQKPDDIRKELLTVCDELTQKCSLIKATCTTQFNEQLTALKLNVSMSQEQLKTANEDQVFLLSKVNESLEEFQAVSKELDELKKKKTDLEIDSRISESQFNKIIERKNEFKKYYIQFSDESQKLNQKLNEYQENISELTNQKNELIEDINKSKILKPFKSGKKRDYASALLKIKQVQAMAERLKEDYTNIQSLSVQMQKQADAQEKLATEISSEQLATIKKREKNDQELKDISDQKAKVEEEKKINEDKNSKNNDSIAQLKQKIERYQQSERDLAQNGKEYFNTLSKIMERIAAEQEALQLLNTDCDAEQEAKVNEELIKRKAALRVIKTDVDAIEKKAKEIK